MDTGALSIKLRCASWQQLGTIYKRDLSRGTMFLKAATPPAIGTEVRIDLTLPSASVIVLTGVVQTHVNDAARGVGVELKLAPIPTGSIWLIESALASERSKSGTPASGVPVVTASNMTSGSMSNSGPIPVISDGGDETGAAEAELIRALLAEVESLKKLNPFLVLGLAYGAGDGEVRAAFGDLTKRYHPDRFARYQSTELRQVAAEIFILIRDAYRRLGNEAGRIQVLTALGKTPTPTGVPAVVIPPAPSGPVRMAAGPPPRAATAPVIPAATPAAGTRAVPPVVAIPAPRQSPMPTPRGVPAAPANVRSPGPVRAIPSVIPSIGPQVPAQPPASKPVEPAQPGSADRRATVPLPLNDSADPHGVEELLDAGRLDEALATYRTLATKTPSERTLRAGVELCEGLRALAQRDRLEAAQRFEAALEIDPSNERAARELAGMRRQATNERKGLLSRLMGKKES